MLKLLITLTIIMSSGVVVLNAEDKESDPTLKEHNEEVANKLDQVLSKGGVSLTPEQRETMINPDTTQEERNAIWEQLKQELKQELKHELERVTDVAPPSDQPDPVKSGPEEQQNISTNVDNDS